MLVSRGFGGVILIAIVFSTVMTLLIIGERPDQLVEIIRNDAPDLDPGSDQKYGFAFTIVCRADFDEVKVKFSWLRSMEPVLAEGGRVRPLDEILPDLVKIAGIEGFLSPFGGQPERIGKQDLPEDWTDGDEVLLLDYSEPFSACMADQSPLVHTTYMLVLTDDNLTGYYEGISDFFPEAEWRLPSTQRPSPTRNPRSGGSIEFGLDEERTRYVSAGEARLYPELPTLDELPPYGEIVFKDVKKDQRLTTMTFFIGRTLGYWGERELIRVYADGQLALVQMN